MSRVNPDPHDEGYVYQPTQAVTARFPAGVDDQAVERALIDAGFRPDQLMVFEGKEGAVQLDLQGVRHGGWVEFRRGLERLFTDETAIFDRTEEVLLSGGVMVAAFTGGDAALKRPGGRGAEVARRAGGGVLGRVDHPSPVRRRQPGHTTGEGLPGPRAGGPGLAGAGASDSPTGAALGVAGP